MKVQRNRSAMIAALVSASAWIVGSPTPLKAEAQRDACAMLTPAQVGPALGVQVDPGRRPVEADPSICVWRRTGKPEGVATNAMVNLLDADRFEQGKALRSGGTRSLESGIGDAAYYSKALGVPTLTVKKGAAYFRIMARLTDTETKQSSADATLDAEKLAEKTLALEILKAL